MPRSLNQVQIIGNLGSDPEVRTTSGGTKVATLSVATSESWEKDGQKHENTEWHRLTLWRGLADVAEKYLSKGDRIFAQGHLKYDSYEKDGVTRYTTEITVRDLIMLGGQASGMQASDPGPGATVDNPEPEAGSASDLPF